MNAIPISPERHRRITDLFLEAIDMPPPARPAFLASRCGDDLAVKYKVEEMLAAHESSGTLLLDQPVFEAGLRLLDLLEDGSGTTLGKYRLIKRLGAGGMGIVYQAARTDIAESRPVAVKLLRLVGDSQTVARRFRSEYEILSRLEHPNIARLIDIGATPAGLPYYVMEYVDGLPVDEYCRQHGLSISARLDLFRRICAALTYAHANMVLHRDIKPSNILVNAEGEPKLLDFGIAKLIKADGGAEEITRLTKAGEWVMTPAYASPEQVRGEALTLSSDLYTLGVLLYKLLTDRLPYHFPGNDSDEIKRVICEAEPIRPGNIDIDLENIVLMALRKEPARRYATVGALVADIENYQRGYPVTAREDTLFYRLCKFLARHYHALAVIALISVVGVAGLASTIWQARRARTQQQLNAARARDIKEFASAFLPELTARLDRLPGTISAQQTLLTESVKQLDRLRAQIGDDPALLRELALAYRKLGDVEGRPFAANTGQSARAREHYRQSVEILRALWQQQPDNMAIAADLALSMERGGEIAVRIDGEVAGLVPYQEACAIRERLASAAPDNRENARLLANCYLKMGDNARLRGELQSAYDLYHKILAMRMRWARAAPDQPPLQRDLAVIYVRLITVLEAMAELVGEKTDLDARYLYRQALFYNEEMLAIAELLARAQPDDAVAQAELAGSELQYAITCLKAGRRRHALNYFERARRTFQRLVGQDRDNANLRGQLAFTWENLGHASAAAGDSASALALLARALAEYTALGELDTNNRQLQQWRAYVHAALAPLWAGRGQHALALSHCRQAHNYFFANYRHSPANAQFFAELLTSARQHARLLISSGQKESARAVIEETLAACLPGLKDDERYAGHHAAYADFLLHCELSEFRDRARALAYAEQAHRLARGTQLYAASVLYEALAANRLDERVPTAARNIAALLPAKRSESE